MSYKTFEIIKQGIDIDYVKNIKCVHCNSNLITILENEISTVSVQFVSYNPIYKEYGNIKKYIHKISCDNCGCIFVLKEDKDEKRYYSYY